MINASDARIMSFMNKNQYNNKRLNFIITNKEINEWLFSSLLPLIKNAIENGEYKVSTTCPEKHTENIRYILEYLGYKVEFYGLDISDVTLSTRLVGVFW